MTELIIVRHGETVWHAENRYAGSTDIAMTDRGHQQAAELADWAKSAGLSAIWASDLRRARETAAPASRATGLEVRIDPRLRELDFGSGEGLTSAEMNVRMPEAWQRFRTDPVVHHLPDGEKPHAAIQRAIMSLREISAEFPSGRVLVTAHNTLLRLVVCHILGVSPSRYRELLPVVRNCALTHLRYQDSRFALLSFNAPAVPEPR